MTRSGGRGVTRRRARSARRSGSKVFIPLAVIHRMMSSIVGKQTRARDGKTEGVRVIRTGAFCLSNLTEQIVQGLLKHGAQVLEGGSKIQPKHLLQGMQKNKAVQRGMFRIIKNPALKEQITELNSQLNETVASGSARGGRSRSRSRRRESQSPRSRSRSRSRSPARASSGKRSSARKSPARSPARRAARKRPVEKLQMQESPSDEDSMEESSPVNEQEAADDYEVNEAR